jgi:hypothetical protein
MDTLRKKPEKINNPALEAKLDPQFKACYISLRMKNHKGEKGEEGFSIKSYFSFLMRLRCLCGFYFWGLVINNLALKGEVCCSGKVFDSGYIPLIRPKGRGMYPSHSINHRIAGQV